MLEQLGHQLLGVIRAGDGPGLTALLGDKVELGPDYGMSKHDLGLELKAKKGLTYASLFDTETFRAIVEKDYKRHFRPEDLKHLPAIESVKSIRDHFLSAKDIKIRVVFLVGETNEEPSLAVVGYDWPGRPSVEELPNPAFMWQSGSWKLTHLFTIDGWAIAAPEYRP